MIGTNQQYSFFSNFLLKNKRSGFFIFAGPKGTGKKELVELMIEELKKGKKEGSGANNLALGQLFLVRPKRLKEKGKIKEKKVAVEEVRQILELMNLKKDKGVCDLAIFYESEKLSDAIQNLMLKNLEEPKEGNVFVFLAEELTGLLPTVVSRSVVFRFYPQSFWQLKAKRPPMSQEERLFWAMNWGRSFKLAQREKTLMPGRKDKDKDKDQEALWQVASQELKQLLTNPDYQKMLLIEQLAKDKRILFKKLDYWINGLLVLLEEEVRQDNFFLGRDYWLLEKVSREELANKLEVLLELRGKLLKLNVNAQLALEKAFL